MAKKRTLLLSDSLLGEELPNILRKSDPVTASREYRKLLTKMNLAWALEQGIKTLKKLLESKGASLEETGRKIGITDEDTLLRLPVVSVATAREFLEMTRQNLHRVMHRPPFPIGIKIDGQYLFSVEELALFSLIPRRPGPTCPD